VASSMYTYTYAASGGAGADAGAGAASVVARVVYANSRADVHGEHAPRFEKSH